MTAGLGVQAAVALYQFLKPVIPVGAFGGKVSAGNVNEFKVGSVSTVRSMHGFVSRLNADSALVMSWKCPHLGCTVPWNPSFNGAAVNFPGITGWFRCPCHGSTYSRAGIRVYGPAPRPMDTMLLTVNGDGSVTLTYGAIPGFAYRLETATNLSPPAWMTVAGSTTNPMSDTVTFTDLNPSGGVTRYYRTSSP